MKNGKFITLFSIGLALSACGDSPSDVHQVSDNLVLQAAYENCLSDMKKGLREDNPDTDPSILKHLDEGARQVCQSTVVITCQKGIESASCQMVLDMYK